MTADEIAEMQADALAGTPGDWQVSGVRYKWRDSFSDKLRDSHSIGPDGDPVGLVFYGAEYHSEMFANARRIARLPRVEAAVTALTAQAEADRIKIEAQAAEIARLRELVRGAYFEGHGHSSINYGADISDCMTHALLDWPNSLSSAALEVQP